MTHESDYHSDNKIVNVASHLKRMAQLQPYKRAVVYPAGRDYAHRVAYSHLTFDQLQKESDCLAHGLNEAGIERGTRTILMARPGPEFFAVIFALFKTGAIPVVVDPGMGLKRMLVCLKQSRPEAFIGIPLAHVLRIVFPGFFKTVRTSVTIGKKWFWGGYTYQKIRKMPWEPYAEVDVTQDETAAILFTTGSTGPAKGVVYTHGIFNAQIERIQSHFNITHDEIDLPTFPLFALFDPALGMTAIIPDMDPTKPAQVNPEKIIEAIVDQGVTNMFASPALLNRVGRYGQEQKIILPMLKRVVSAGAPVMPSSIGQFCSMLCKDAEVHTPYGATEAMPVLSIASNEILSETKHLSEQGFGNCIGRPVPPIEVTLIKVTDEPIETWSDELLVSEGEVGEITVKGDRVTRHYFENPEAEQLSKIRDGNTFRHRMGDLGWRDNHGRIWFCGRKSHRVITETQTLYTLPSESVFNNHPMVFRSALVGIGLPGAQIPIICIELQKNSGFINKSELKTELLELAKSNPQTRFIQTVLFHPSFPVDIRHNSKIFREQLAIWAEKKMDG
jgi:acyl-CoA synthetase (AMP-forming)/AMP-acid ligase II